MGIIYTSYIMIIIYFKQEYFPIKLQSFFIFSIYNNQNICYYKSCRKEVYWFRRYYDENTIVLICIHIIHWLKFLSLCQYSSD